MAFNVPVHQFEIRFTYLLNFSKIAGEVLSPFIPLATNINIENAHSSQLAKYTLQFSKEYYVIIISWDRIIFRYERDPKIVAVNNSIFEEPFLNLFSKLKAHPEFGKVKNFLSYTIYINQTGDSKENIIEQFKKNNLVKTKIDTVLGPPSDLSITLAKIDDVKQTHVIFGPYFGTIDLVNRKAMPTFETEIEDLNTCGEMAEVKIYENTDTITFSKFKEVIKRSQEIIDGLWNKQ